MEEREAGSRGAPRCKKKLTPGLAEKKAGRGKKKTPFGENLDYNAGTCAASFVGVAELRSVLRHPRYPYYYYKPQTGYNPF